MKQLELLNNDRKPIIGQSVYKNESYFGSIILIKSIIFKDNQYKFSVETYASYGNKRYNTIILKSSDWNGMCWKLIE